MKQIILILEDPDGDRTAKLIEASGIEAALKELRESRDSYLYQDYKLVEAKTV